MCELLLYYLLYYYTITHTQARWIGRLTDNCIVNFAELGEFIEKLEVRYNPLSEFVLKAHCIDMGLRENRTGIPQGGAGFILSRFACEISLQHRIPVFQNLLVSEDQSIGLYLTSQGFPPIAMAGNNFIGHGLKPDQRIRLAMGNKMPECGSLRAEFLKWRADKCGWFLTPLNEVIFVHEIPYRGWGRLLRLAYGIFHAPFWVLWFNGYFGWPRLCQERNETLFGRLNFWNSPQVKWKSDSWY
jgi:hypothetical protein